MMDSSEQKRIVDLGAFGIIREAFSLYRAHAKSFRLIRLTLILPIAILLVAAQYIADLYRWKHFPETSPQTSTHVTAGLSNSQPHLGLSSNLHTIDVTGTLIKLAVWIFSVVVTAVSDSAILYSSGLIYTGKKVAFLDVLRATIPRLWTRLTVTYLYVVVLDFSIIIHVIISGAFRPVLEIKFQGNLRGLGLLLMAIALLLLFLLATLFYLQMIASVAAGVSILEKHYGWAAFNRAIKLLQGRRKVAGFFQVLCVVPVFLLRPLTLDYHVVRTWSSTPVLLKLVAGIVWRTFLLQMAPLCAGVQYASFKAYHNESISDLSVKGDIPEGYERVGSEDDQAGHNNAWIHTHAQQHESIV